MIIEINDDGHGAWNLTAKTDKNAWPPLYMAYGRSIAQIEFLMRGIIGDLKAADRGDAVAREVVTAPRRLKACVETWPDAEEGAYNPACCRFPKSCSALTYDPATVSDDDLEDRR